MRARLQKLDWSYIFIELLIVTTGVLIALALDQWLASRHERAEEKQLLTAVRAEFRDVLKDMGSEKDGFTVYPGIPAGTGYRGLGHQR